MRRLSLIFILIFVALWAYAQETIPIRGLKRTATIEIYKRGKIERYLVAEYEEGLGTTQDRRAISVFITKLEEKPAGGRFQNYTILRANFQNVSLGTTLYTLARLMEKNIIFGKELYKEAKQETGVTEVRVYNTRRGLTEQRGESRTKSDETILPIGERKSTRTSEERENIEETRGGDLREQASLTETYSMPSYLLQPINLVIERPISAQTLFHNLLREYNLIAVKLSENLLKVGVKDSIEFSLNTDDEKVVSDLIRRIKLYVSPAGHVVYDKALRKIIVTDLKENIEKLRGLREDFYSLLDRKVKETEESAKTTDTKVFYFASLRDFELAKEIIRRNYRGQISVSEDKDFNALIVTGDKNTIRRLSQELKEFSSVSDKTKTLVTKVFYVRYITPENLKKMIEPLLSEEGSVYLISSQDIYQKSDYERDRIAVRGSENLEQNAFADINKERESKIVARNMILIRDYPERVEQIYREFRKFLSEKPIKILIKARFLEVQKNLLRELGIDWRVLLSNERLPLSWSGTASFGVTGARRQGLLAFTLQKGKLNSLELALRAYERENMARSVAEPYVLTSNGEPAIVSSGLEYPVLELNITQQLSQITWRYINIPITLVATPIVLPDNSILLNITLTRKQIVDYFRFPITQGFTQDIPILSSSRIDAKIPVKNGETIVIGGILEKTDTKSEEGIPGFRRIPLLGWLFKSEIKELRDKELLIFLTPEIVEED